MRFNVLFLLLIISGIADAATVKSLQVSKHKKFYETRAEFIVDAPRADVFQAFTLFENLSRINPSIIDSSATPISDNTTRVTTRVKDCMGLFCKSLTLVEDVTIFEGERVRSQMVKGLGDFDAGLTEWIFQSEGEKTRVVYSSRVKPGFWLPPLVGKKAMKKALREQIVDSVENLEAIFSQ